MRQITYLLLLALWAGMSGCCTPCRTYQKQQRPLVDTEWQLVQLNGRNLPSESEGFTLHFTPAGEVQGVAACNRLMGSFTTSKERTLKIGPLASTRRMCRDPREGEFFEALNRVTHYEMDGPMMMLLSEGSLLMILQSKSGNKE